MAVKFEVGTWTGNNSTPQTITLADSTLTPIAIIVWMTGQAAAPAAGSVAGNEVMSIGFGTRRGGSTQAGCVGIWSSDAAATGSTGRTRDGTNILKVLSAEVTTDYTVGLSSFGAGQFVVTYSSAANANGDFFHYAVFGGSDLTDANVINETMDGTTTQSITGVGFQPDVLFAIDADLTGTTNTSNIALGFGVASSPTQFWTQCITATDGDTMASTMNWNNQSNTANCLARLTINADTQSALWDLNSFDSDGATLGVNDAPPATTSICTFLFIKGGSWEAGQKAKITTTGNDTFTLANSNMVVRGVILGNVEHTTNAINAASTAFVLGAGSTANATRGSAVNNCIGLSGDEIIATHADRYRATDAITAIVTDGDPSSVLTEAWYDTAGTGSFVIEWDAAEANAHLISYLAIGDSPTAPTTRNLALMGVGQ